MSECISSLGHVPSQNPRYAGKCGRCQNPIPPAPEPIPTTAADQVRQFHEAIGAPVLDKPTIPSEARCKLRGALLWEESREALEEFAKAREGNGDLAAIAKELADVIVVTYGAALEYGIDLDAVLVAVHESNMSKVEGMERRADGKVLKGPNYRKPDIAGVLGL